MSKKDQKEESNWIFLTFALDELNCDSESPNFIWLLPVLLPVMMGRDGTVALTSCIGVHCMPVEVGGVKMQRRIRWWIEEFVVRYQKRMCGIRLLINKGAALVV